MTTPQHFGYLMQPTPTNWNFSGDPKITGGKSWCDVKKNADGSITVTPRGPYANVYFWAEHLAPLPCTIWATGYQVLVDDYSAVQAVEYDGQIQLTNWLYNFGLQLDRQGSKKVRFFQYHPPAWQPIGDLNMADFTDGKPVQFAAAFNIDMLAHTIMLLGMTTANAEYKPNSLHHAYFQSNMPSKWTQGGQIDFDGSGRGATFTIKQHVVGMY